MKTRINWKLVIVYLVTFVIAILSIADIVKAHNIFFVILHIGIDVTLIMVIIIMLKQEKAFKKRISKLKSIIKSCYQEIDFKDSEHRSLVRKYGRLETWKINAIAADPEIETKVNVYIAAARGKEFSEKHANCDSLESLAAMFEEYDLMSPQAKTFVTLDMDGLSERLHDLAFVKAKEVMLRLKESCKVPDDRENLEFYRSTIDYYNALPQCVKDYIDYTLIIELYERCDNAQRDYLKHKA